MAARSIEDSATSPYAVLRVSRYATELEIKQAYRELAKAAHPDAGGNAAAMSRINEAYAIIGDPKQRELYDYQAKNSVSNTAATNPTNTHATSPSSAQSSSRDMFERRRRSQARRYVWSLIEEYGFLALLVTAALGFVTARNTGMYAWLFGIASFIPIYWIAFQVIYLICPDFKLIIYDTIRAPHRAHSQHLRTLILSGTVWLPLSFIWSAGLQVFFKP